jgi:hypothetical protein
VAKADHLDTVRNDRWKNLGADIRKQYLSENKAEPIPRPNALRAWVILNVRQKK